ncbi:MAG: 30S ribosomal protein S2 [Planctomycetes bacterium]|nr:30S ribosomal protein S2 [Planctomycetota bacterium]
MSAVNLQELIDAGVHFGHQARRWNPKMKPFIHGKRHNIHLIDLKQTVRGLLQATHFLRRLASTGAQILFVGTKKQIRQVVDAEAKRCGMPAITERWIGGSLTNFNTVRERLQRLEELEAAEADGTMERHKKKAQSMLRREMRKIQRNLEGLRELAGMPGAIVVVDPRREDIALKEAARMNVPVIAILDTDCDPSLADIVVPGNDDAVSSVQLLMGRLVDAILEGRAGLDEQTLLQAQRAAADDPRARVVQGRGGRGPGGGERSGGGRGEGGGREGGRGGGGREGGRGGGRGRGGDSAGRLGRRSTGRFADRAGGHAETVSVGGDAASEAAQIRSNEAAPGEAAPAPAVELPPSSPPPSPAPDDSSDS